MNELDKRLYDDAQNQLKAMVERTLKDAMNLCEGTGVKITDLLKLALGGRTEAVKKKCIKDLVVAARNKLLEQYAKTPKDVAEDKDSV